MTFRELRVQLHRAPRRLHRLIKATLLPFGVGRVEQRQVGQLAGGERLRIGVAGIERQRRLGERYGLALSVLAVLRLRQFAGAEQQLVRGGVVRPCLCQ